MSGRLHASRRGIRLLFAAVALAVALLASVTAARADVFRPIQLVSDEHVLSAGGLCAACEQALYAHDPAISANGRYVAFDGFMRGLTGVWRRNLESGVVEPVSVGEPNTPAGSAELPSISEDGQYVSFTTQSALSPRDDKNTGPDVYVRDMEVPESQPCTEEEALHPAQPCAFTLASAVTGSRQGLVYEYLPSEDPASEEARFGAMAAGRTALDDKGDKVVFVTTAASDLQGEGAPETPALEVAVRDLETGTTEVVSVELDPATGRPVLEDGRTKPAQSFSEDGNTYGAVYHAGSNPPAFKDPLAYELTRQAPASISADGSTVAWLAQDVGEQAPTLAAEPLFPKYSEPLWRRIGEGREAPTRRVTGGSDPTNPACVASGETALPLERSLSDPCQGPFRTEGQEGVWTGGAGNTVPQLSANGDEVAFLANVPLVARGEDFGLPATSAPSDLYVVDMKEGLSRVQALTPLTELASGETTKESEDGPIIDLGISPSGTQIAFTTKRTEFPLGFPAYVSTSEGIPGLLELFDADLEDGTLTRVTHGVEGGASEHPHEFLPTLEDEYQKAGDGALSPSFSSNELLAFSSTGSNLVVGDGNTPPLDEEFFDGSDAFAVQREVFVPVPAPQLISPAPQSPTPVTPWNVWVTSTTLANGSVRLNVETPGAGLLRAVASGAVTVQAHAAGSSRSSRVSGRERSRAHAKTSVVDRELASVADNVSAADEGLSTLTLTLSPGYSSLAASVGGLSATVSVTFAAAGHPLLHTSITVLFHTKPHAARRARASAHRGARGRKGR
jgi:hypothetical protein